MKQFILLLVLILAAAVQGFFPVQRSSNARVVLQAETQAADPNELVGKRITVTGDVQGGYYRSCVSNEAGRFRRLVGTMTPPDDSKTAEIYVEGKRKMVDGFVRWCEKGDVGLNQQAKVTELKDEEFTGLYEGFYIKTH